MHPHFLSNFCSTTLNTSVFNQESIISQGIWQLLERR